MGALLFDDVRVLSVRGDRYLLHAWAHDQLGDDAWALQLEATEYLAEARSQDPQRAVEHLQDHYQFFVPDSWHYSINIIARKCTVATIPTTPGMDFSALLEKITPFRW